MCHAHQVHSKAGVGFNGMRDVTRSEYDATGGDKELLRLNHQLWQSGETRPKHTITSLSMAYTINDIMLTTSNPKQSRGSHWIELNTCVHVHFTFLEQTELLSPVRTRGKEMGAHSTTRAHDYVTR